MRDGRLAEIAGTAGFTAGADPWAAAFGSFLYCWRAGRMPLEGLATASVIAGHYSTGPAADGTGRLHVAGRARIRLARRPVGEVAR